MPPKQQLACKFGCNKAYSSKQSRSEHHKLKHNDEFKQAKGLRYQPNFSCEQCDKKFGSYGSLKFHRHKTHRLVGQGFAANQPPDGGLDPLQLAPEELHPIQALSSQQQVVPTVLSEPVSVHMSYSFFAVVEMEAEKWTKNTLPLENLNKLTCVAVCGPPISAQAPSKSCDKGAPERQIRQQILFASTKVLATVSNTYQHASQRMGNKRLGALLGLKTGGRS